MYTDPFVTTRDRVVSDFADVESALESFRQLPPSPDAPWQHMAIALQRNLDLADGRLGELEASIGIIEGSRQKFSISEAELAARKNFVRDYRARVAHARSVWRVACQRFTAASGDQLFVEQDLRVDTLREAVSGLGDIASVIGEEATAQTDMLDEFGLQVTRVTGSLKQSDTRLEAIRRRAKKACNLNYLMLLAVGVMIFVSIAVVVVF